MTTQNDMPRLVVKTGSDDLVLSHNEDDKVRTIGGVLAYSATDADALNFYTEARGGEGEGSDTNAQRTSIQKSVDTIAEIGVAALALESNVAIIFGTYGVFTLIRDEATDELRWEYQLAHDDVGTQAMRDTVQALGTGDVVYDVLGIYVSDGITPSLPIVLTVTITGENDDPTQIRNNGMAYDSDAESTLLSVRLLQWADVDDDAEQITYTLTAIPASGVLQLNNGSDWTDLAVSNTFTQADINASRVRYVPDALAPTSVSFKFTVSDGESVASAEQTFQITVRETYQLPDDQGTEAGNNVDLSTETTPQTVETGEGEDEIIDSKGNDRIDAGRDDDMIDLGTGGADEVIYEFEKSDDGYIALDGGDDIINFRRGEDRLVFNDAQDTSFIDDVNDKYKVMVNWGTDANGGWVVEGLYFLFVDAVYSSSGSIANSMVSLTFSNPIPADEFLILVDNDGPNDGYENGLITTADALRAVLGVDSIAPTIKNAVPIVANPINDQTAAEDAEFSFTFDEAVFSDADGDTLAYTAKLAGGVGLPNWLEFNADTRTFSGTPTNDDVGNYTIIITAKDRHNETVTDEFTIMVVNTNDAPVVTNSGTDAIVVIEGESATITEAMLGVSDEDDDDNDANGNLLGTMVLKVSDVQNGKFQLSGADVTQFTLADVRAGNVAFVHDGGEQFEVVNGSITNTPRSTHFTLVANDGDTDSAPMVFTLDVTPVNDAVMVSDGVDDQTVTTGAVFTFSIAETAFADIDSDIVSYAATLADGSELPDWLSFDAATRTFSGIRLRSDVGTTTIRVTATDDDGNTASDDFVLTVEAGEATLEISTIAGTVSVAESADYTTDTDAGLTFRAVADIALTASHFTLYEGTSQTASTRFKVVADASVTNGWKIQIVSGASFDYETDGASIALRVVVDDGAGTQAEANSTFSIENVEDEVPVFTTEGATSAGQINTIPSVIVNGVEFFYLGDDVPEEFFIRTKEDSVFNYRITQLGGITPRGLRFNLDEFTRQDIIDTINTFKNEFSKIIRGSQKYIQLSDERRDNDGDGHIDQIIEARLVDGFDAHGLFMGRGVLRNGRYDFTHENLSTIIIDTPISVDENSDVNDVVLTVTATDADNIDGTTPTESITYELVADLQGSDNEKFIIDETTGEVRFIDSPDFETQSSYVIYIRAISTSTLPSGMTRQSDLIQYTVNVNNVNEAPEIDSGGFMTQGVNVNGLIFTAIAGQVPDGVKISFVSDSFGGSFTDPVEYDESANQLTIHATSGRHNTLNKLMALINGDSDANSRFTLSLADGVDGDAAINTGSSAWELQTFTLSPQNVTITEGGSFTLNETILGVSDNDVADNDADGNLLGTIVLKVSNIQNGTIQLSGVDVTQFTLADVRAGNVVFVHDGGEQFETVNGFKTDTPRSTHFTLVASDANSDSEPVIFTLDVTPVNDALVVADGIGDQTLTTGGNPFFSIPATAFADADSNIASYTATLADGTALPSWLDFDTDTGGFTATPLKSDAGSITIRVTATNTEGDTVSDDFVLTIEASEAALDISGIAGHASAQENIDYTTDTDAGLTFRATSDSGLTASNFTVYEGASETASTRFKVVADTGTTNGWKIQIISGASFDYETDGASLPLRVVADDGAGEQVERNSTFGIENVDDVGPEFEVDGPTSNGQVSFAPSVVINGVEFLYLGDDMPEGFYIRIRNDNEFGYKIKEIVDGEGDLQGLRFSFDEFSRNNIIDLVNTDSSHFTFTVRGRFLPPFRPIDNRRDRDGDGKKDQILEARLVDGFDANGLFMGPGVLTHDDHVLVVKTETATIVDTPVSFDENGNADDVVFTVAAKDDDNVAGETPTETFTYELVRDLQGSDNDKFIIDAATGAVRFIASPDYETQASYNVYIRATSTSTLPSSTPRQSDIIQYTVNVNDVNEAPEIAGIGVLPGTVNVNGLIFTSIVGKVPADVDVFFSYYSGSQGFGNDRVQYDETAAQLVIYGRPRVHNTLNKLMALINGDGDANSRFTLSLADDADGDAEIDLTDESVWERQTFSLVSQTATPVIGQGGRIIITEAMLGVSDVDADDNDANGDPLGTMLLKASNVQNGTFQLSGVDVTQFTLADVRAGNVEFVHDGSTVDANSPTGFTLIANDGEDDSAPVAFVLEVDAVPIIKNAIINQTATEGVEFSFTFDANTFADANGDTLTYTATLRNGNELPDWLSFDAETRTFSGTPFYRHVGNHGIAVTADDGNGGTVTDEFFITVEEVPNIAPTVTGAVADQTVDEDAEFSLNLGTVFSDANKDLLTYSVSGADWLSISEGVLSGTPLQEHIGTYTITLAADDGRGGTVSDEFVITVENTNDAPTVANPVPDQRLLEGESFRIDVNTVFTDIDEGDTLSLSSEIVGWTSSVEPKTWLRYNPITDILHGTAPVGSSGTVTVEVNATDAAGDKTVDIFVIHISAPTPVASAEPVKADSLPPVPATAPIVANPIADQVITEGTEFSFTIPSDAFTDADGDRLTYVAALNEITVLPDWLNFDADTRTFSGTTPVGGASFTVAVTASDDDTNSVTDKFTLTIDSPARFDAETNGETGSRMEQAVIIQGIKLIYTGNDIAEGESFFLQIANDNTDGIKFDVRHLGGPPAGIHLTLTDVSSFLTQSFIDSNTPRLKHIVDLINDSLPNFPNAADVRPESKKSLVRAELVDPSTGDDLFDILAAVAGDGTYQFETMAVDGLQVTDPVIWNQHTDAADILFTVSASDADANDVIHYEFANERGNNNNYFTIDRNTGAVRFADAPDHEADPADYAVFVKAVSTKASGSTVEAVIKYVVNFQFLNEAPIVANPIANQMVAEGDLFSFIFDTNTFTDADGDTLTYNASLADGSALPGWLLFDADTRSFSGTPPEGDDTSLTIAVTATDGVGAEVTDEFTLTIDRPVRFDAETDGETTAETEEGVIIQGIRIIYAGDNATEGQNFFLEIRNNVNALKFDAKHIIGPPVGLRLVLSDVSDSPQQSVIDAYTPSLQNIVDLINGDSTSFPTNVRDFRKDDQKSLVRAELVDPTTGNNDFDISAALESDGGNRIYQFETIETGVLRVNTPITWDENIDTSAVVFTASASDANADDRIEYELISEGGNVPSGGLPLGGRPGGGLPPGGIPGNPARPGGVPNNEQSDDNRFFTINETTGEVRFAETPDFETQASYEVRIRVVSTNPNGDTTEATIIYTVNLNDMPETAPTPPVLPIRPSSPPDPVGDPPIDPLSPDTPPDII